MGVEKYLQQEPHTSAGQVPQAANGSATGRTPTYMVRFAALNRCALRMDLTSCRRKRATALASELSQL